MSSGSSSDHEEGFAPSKLQVQPRAQLTPSPSLHPVESPFTAKYLHWNYMIRKEPEASIQPQSQLPIRWGSTNAFENDSTPPIDSTQGKKARRRTKTILQPLHPYYVYSSTDNYELVYSKISGAPISKEGVNYTDSDHSVVIPDSGVTSSQTGRSQSTIRPIKHTEQSSDMTSINGIVFDSKFECGNLHCAYKRKKPLLQKDMAVGQTATVSEYHLFMQNDTNTLGYTQWFYFSVAGLRPGNTYRFRIVNFKKKHSFFKEGYLPAVFSCSRSLWERRANKVSYDQSMLELCRGVRLFELNLQITVFEGQNKLYIASSLPYSYSRLIKYLGEVVKHPLVELSTVGKSLCGNDVPEVKISPFKPRKQQKMIVILARQHPGETWSSFLMEAILRILTEKTNQESWLQNNYTFLAYPMVNVDGVVHGNFRCDMTGVDMNRRWRQPSMLMHPQLHMIKQRISQITRRDPNSIEYVLDLHGHSKSYNIFVYSCRQNIFSCRLFAYALSEQAQMASQYKKDSNSRLANSSANSSAQPSTNPSVQSVTKNVRMFHFPSCTFGLTPDKFTTARATISRLIKSENVATVQCSAFGFRDSNGKVEHFQPFHMHVFASQVLSALECILNKGSASLERLKNEINAKIQELVEVENMAESGSESDPSADEIEFEVKMKSVFPQRVFSEESTFVKSEASKAKQKNSTRKNKTKNVSPKLLSVRQLTQKQQIPKSSQLGEIVELKTVTVSRRKPSDSFMKKLPRPLTKKQQVKSSTLDKPSRSSQMSKMNRLESPPIPLPRTNPRLSSNWNSSEEEPQNIPAVSQPQPMRTLKPNFRAFESGRSANMSHIEQSLFKDDQLDRLNILLENKKRIELEKIKRDIELSTSIVERQGKIRSLTNRKEQIIDYKRFKGINDQKERKADNGSHRQRDQRDNKIRHRVSWLSRYQEEY